MEGKKGHQRVSAFQYGPLFSLKDSDPMPFYYYSCYMGLAWSLHDLFRGQNPESLGTIAPVSPEYNQQRRSNYFNKRKRPFIRCGKQWLSRIFQYRAEIDGIETRQLSSALTSCSLNPINCIAVLR